MKASNAHRLLLRAAALVLVVLAAKLWLHFRGGEILSLNPLFSGIVAADVFLMGFLLNGVLSDFKESEKLPGELAASLETLAQEVRAIALAKPESGADACLAHLAGFSRAILDWFHKRERSSALFAKLDEFTPHFVRLEAASQATLIARLKAEAAQLRRSLTRVHTIRETSFITSGYRLADLVTLFLCVGLVLVRIEPFRESLFFVTIISYFMIYLLMLIRDLDNPFGYYDRRSGEDVSLKPLDDAIARIDALVRAGTP